MTEVRIFDEPQNIEPPNYAFDERSPTLVAQSPRMHRASATSRKLTGRTDRPSMKSMPSSSGMIPQLSKTISNLGLESPDIGAKSADEDNDDQGLLDQVMQWLQNERSRRHSNRADDNDVDPKAARRPSTRPQPDLSLDQLEAILSQFSGGISSRARRMTGGASRRGSLARTLMKSQRSVPPSDTDAADAVAVVPHIEASLDNTKTLSFSGGAADESNTDHVDQTREEKSWVVFKQDILRLTHTLGLRGWRRLPLDDAKAITVERLSGALTNAVYVVKPPINYKLMQRRDDQGNLIPIKRLPKHLLLRIYGPSTEHLIDRENELLILRRLAAKNIGPKLLGYFDNGRFEEFLHAKTLTLEDLRDPSTSKQIAKRMKELHDGIELLESERKGGAFTFASWNNWVSRAEKVMTYLDQLVDDTKKGMKPPKARYTRRGYICGTRWTFFRQAYERYRANVLEEMGGEAGIQKRLVFAHNDTQYGNLMKLQPEDKSPLMQPVNQHKQLVVIDFEYANADPRGYEFANHFNEWCYNYHHPEKPYAFNSTWYPTPEEQYRFLRAYVMHRPQFAPSASATPNMEAREKTNIPDFMLDARTPGAYLSGAYDEEERAREKAQELEIQGLLHETRLWRMASSGFWVAWGIVQAQVPELDEPAPKKSIKEVATDTIKSVLKVKSDPLDDEVKAKQEEAKMDRPEGHEQEQEHHEGSSPDNDEEEFDYLAYAQERAMFFWGDCVQMGIVKESDLPEEMRPHIKYVKY